MKTPVYSKHFEKDYSKILKSKKNLNFFLTVSSSLLNGQKLDIKYRDHKLKGKWVNYRECHIRPNWLLIYRLEADKVYFVRTGSHSELFS